MDWKVEVLRRGTYDRFQGFESMELNCWQRLGDKGIKLVKFKERKQ